MKNLILIGAGEWGLEVFAWLSDAVDYDKEFTFKGFLDLNPNALENKNYIDAKILGSTSSYEVENNDVFICAIADPKSKEKAIQNIINKGGQFICIIHKSVILFKNICIGEGVILSPSCIVSNNVTIGDHSSFNLMCSIGHDVVIGKYCQVNSHCDITGNCSIGDHVLFGSSACLVPKVTIGNNAVIGAGSVVIKNIQEGKTVFGNPAKNII